MKIPKFLENTILGSDNVKEKLQETKAEVQQESQTKYNKDITNAINKALRSAKKDWSVDTAKAMDKRFGTARQYISTSGNYGQEKFNANIYRSGKNYATLSTLFSDSPGSIQSASRIRDAVIGGGYVIKQEEGKKGTKKDLKRLIEFFDMPNPDDTIETLLGVSIEKIGRAHV